MNNINIVGNKCCGCRSCEQVCPKNAISFEFNKEGFLYPIINFDKCINCGICVNKCPILVESKKIESQECYSFVNPNQDDLLKSTSGGFAQFLMRYYFDNGYYVCGCIYDDEFKPILMVTNDKTYLDKMISSKYVQSDTSDVYSKIKILLDSGEKVLFIGLPCQVYGLLVYLGNKKYDNLLTVDLICHGVPSTKLFIDYIKYVSLMENSNVVEYNFRLKKNNVWKARYYYKYCTEKKCRIGNLLLDKYGYDFLNCLNYRESCYQCKFANIENRPADFTIGDFWGVHKNKLKPYYNKKGVSSLIVNTKKGKAFLESNIPSDSINKCDKNLIMQENLIRPSKRPISRDNYYDDYKDWTFWKNKKPVWFRHYSKRLIAKISNLFRKDKYE